MCRDELVLLLTGTADDFIHEISGAEVLKIIVQISKALEYMHDKDIIHCDVKPTNILIQTNKCATLADFGSCIYLNV